MFRELLCRHKWEHNVKKSIVDCCIIQLHIQFLCKKCYKFQDITYYICYARCGNRSYAEISERWEYIKVLTEKELITKFQDRETMIDTITADLKYKSFIKKLEKKYGIIID